MRRRHLTIAAFAALGAVAAAACQPVAAPPPPPPPSTPSCSAAPGSTIPGQWVATVDPDGPAPTEVVTFDAPTEAAREAEVDDLDEDGTVLTVEPDRVVVALDTVMPDDDENYASQQAAFTEAGFPGAWSAGFGGNGVTIAILDTGVQAGHEDLVGSVVPGADLVSGSVASPKGTTDFAQVDPHSHGTHVAGIAAANDDVETGGIGGAPLATVLPVRVLNSCGTGSIANVAQGIRWAADAGAEVISMSLGGGNDCGPDTAIAEAVEDARVLGAVVVAAAGNSGSSAVGVPALCDGVVGVGWTVGVGTGAERESRSNYGPDVDIAAPGTNILSTVPSSAYGQKSGTSMATPFVAAAAALVVQQCGASLPSGRARGDRVVQLLLDNQGPVVASTLQPFPGRLDAAAAIAAACTV